MLVVDDGCRIYVTKSSDGWLADLGLYRAVSGPA